MLVPVILSNDHQICIIVGENLKLGKIVSNQLNLMARRT